MRFGERKVTRAFLLQEIEEKEAEAKEMAKAMRR